MKKRTGTAAVSVVVLSHNRLEDLRANVLSLLAGGSPELELIVVDNASTDGSREFLQRVQLRNPAVQIVLMDRNMGVAVGRNAGFRLARGEYIVSLDDDACMAVSDIRRVPVLFGVHSRAGILAFTVCHAKTGEKQNDHGNRVISVANFHGAAHAIRKVVFDRVGYLDELCTFGGEEFDYSVRCHAAGYETVYLPEVQASHNSFLRPGPAGADRREKWVYNYVRVLYKLFPAPMAFLYSVRYVYTMVRSGQSVYGFPLVRRLLKAACLGRNHGRAVHSPVPAATVSFYSDPGLRPEFGNVPLDFPTRIAGRWSRLRRKVFPSLSAPNAEDAVKTAGPAPRRTHGTSS